MTAKRCGGQAARALFALLAFVLLASVGNAVGNAVGRPVGPPASVAAPAPAHGAPAGHVDGLLGAPGGSPAVLPPPSRIPVVVNRGGDGPGAPSFGAAAAKPAAAALTVRAGNATRNAPSRADEPDAGTVRGRAPPR